MDFASHSLMLFLVFCLVPRGILSQISTAPIVSLEGFTTYAVLNRQKVIACTVTDSTGTNLTVTWQKNAVTLTNSITSGYTWSSTPVNNHSDLTIQSVQQGDEAVFTCVAQNGLRGKSEFSTEMIIIGTPRILLTIADGVSQVAVGGTTILQCNISGSKNTLANTSITFHGPSGHMLPSANLRTSTDSLTSELTLTSLSTSDSGIYICSASTIAGNTTSNTVVLTVIDDPIVTIPDASTYATTGLSKSMECKVSGSSISSVTWSHNEVSLTVGPKYSWNYSQFGANLTVNNLTKADAGTYKCLAQNAFGVTAEDTIDLIVEDILSVTIDSETDGILGLSKTISCSITGTPINTVQWLFNGNQLSKNSKYSWNTGGTADLYISSITLDSSGIYTCWAFNQVSTQQNSVSLTVISPPNVTIVSGKPTFGIVGQSKTIFCQVSGTRVSTVTWFFDSIPLNISSQYSWRQNLISGHTNLTISVLRKSDSGTYNCSARNDAGTISDSVVLSAEEILHVTVTSRTETYIAGTVNTLHCTITGTPITSIQWSFNGINLTNNGLKYYWPTSSTPNLQISNLTIGDAGMYTCSASNQAGTDFASITLTVIARPVVTIGSSTGLSANEGENVLITCVITNTATIDTLQWYFQDRFLYHSDLHYSWSNVSGVSIPFDGSLTIYNVTSQDTGTYKCQATNAAGAGEDSTGLFVLAVPNVMIGGPSSLTTYVGQALRIPCTATGSTSITFVQWYHNNVPLDINGVHFSWNNTPASGTGVTITHDGTLTVSAVQIGDGGIYQCRAGNMAGARNASVQVTVYDDLIVTIPDTSTYATTGLSKSMECQVSGSSISSVTWSHNGISLTVGPKYSWTYSQFGANLTVYNLTKADAGTYKCLAQNTIGDSAEDNIDLTVEDILSVTIGSVTDGILGQKKTIPCSITGTPINTVQWLLNYNQLSNSSQHSWITGGRADLYISSLTLDSSGIYTCLALNQVSTTKDNVYLTVISPPNVTIVSSKPIFGIVGQSQTIFCQVSGTRVSTVKWYFNDIPLNISSQYSWRHNLTNGRADLTVFALLKSDSGTYKCSARNDAGTSSDSVILSAEEILHVTVTSRTETYIVGKVKTLQCTITGTPITSIQWSFNGNNLTNNGLKHYWPTSSTPNLQISNLTIGDAGIYTCSASNQAGTDFASIGLIVIDRPVVTIGNSTDLSVNRGENVLITCIITNTTTIVSLQWYFQDRFLCESDPHYSWSSVNNVSIPFDGSLKIYNVTSQDTGRYKCQATNAAGAGEDFIALYVLVRNSTWNAGSNICGQERQEGPNVPAIIVGVVFGVLLVVSVFLNVHLSIRRWRYCERRTETQSQSESDEPIFDTVHFPPRNEQNTILEKPRVPSRNRNNTSMEAPQFPSQSGRKTTMEASRFHSRNGHNTTMQEQIPAPPNRNNTSLEAPQYPSQNGDEPIFDTVHFPPRNEQNTILGKPRVPPRNRHNTTMQEQIPAPPNSLITERDFNFSKVLKGFNIVSSQMHQ